MADQEFSTSTPEHAELTFNSSPSSLATWLFEFHLSQYSSSLNQIVHGSFPSPSGSENIGSAD
ncbi:MAG: hypothetical protein Q9227_008291 [Pyrenula ochraceoflavens]